MEGYTYMRTPSTFVMYRKKELLPGRYKALVRFDFYAVVSDQRFTFKTISTTPVKIRVSEGSTIDWNSPPVGNYWYHDQSYWSEQPTNSNYQYEKSAEVSNFPDGATKEKPFLPSPYINDFPSYVVGKDQVPI